MPNMNAFVIENRPTSIGNLIGIKPTSITVLRKTGTTTTTLAAQTVRLETLASQKQIITSAGDVRGCDAMALGYKNHPTIADTDLKPLDRFVADSVSYEVVQVMPAHVECLQIWLQVRA